MGSYRIGMFGMRALAVCLAMSLLVASAVAQDGKKLIPIRIAATPDAISVPQWIAQEEGLFEKHGLKPEETIYNVNYQGLLAIGARQGDASIQSDPPTISSLAKGIDAVAVAVVGRFPAGYKLVTRKGVASIADLKGKKVAWPAGTGAEYALLSVAKAMNFDVADFEHVDLPPAEAVPLLLKGDVSATFYWEPWARIALRKGSEDFHVLASSEGIYESNMFLTVGKQFAEKHPEGVKALIRVFQDSHALLKKHPEKAVEVFRKRMRVDEESAKDSLGDYTYMVTLDEQTASSAKSVAAWLLNNKKIERLPDWRAAFSSQYLKAVDPAAVEGFPW